MSKCRCPYCGSVEVRLAESETVFVFDCSCDACNNEWVAEYGGDDMCRGEWVIRYTE